MYWLIVPRIAEFRPQLEARASRVLGVTVRIGAITAHSTGLLPSFELNQVLLFDAQGREALRLPRILATLSPRSIWHLGFEQLYVDQPELNIRRATDGKISVAGLDFSSTGNSGPDAADWFFSQLEFAIHDGTIHWTDEMRDVPALALTQVSLVVRNQTRHHDLRLDATPPAQWGERFTVMAKMQQPLLSRHKGRWQDWDGQLYADFDRVDLSELRRYADVGIDLAQGRGALAAWGDVSRGELVGGVADVALSEVSVTLGKGLQPLELLSVTGRLGGRLLASGFEVSTQALQFETRDGLHWPGGNARITYLGAEGKIEARGELNADKLDLAALSQIANRLPITPQARAALQTYAPKGLVERLQAKWQGSTGAWSHYEAKGLVSQLTLEAHPANRTTQDSTPPNPWLMLDSPGIRGARIEFDVNQAAGKAKVRIDQGAVTLPGFFEEPEIALTEFSADAAWQLKGEHLAVQVPNARFANADAQGSAQVKWETGDPAHSFTHDRFPGVLDLQATLTDADARRVHRYLPSAIEREARDYVREAVVGGTLNTVKFKIKGDLGKLPFTDAKQGEFRVAADVKNASLAYVPRNFQPRDAMPWPALTQLSGELVIDHLQLLVKGARAKIGANVQFSKIEAQIPDLNHATVQVNADARGPMAEVLGIVNGSPLGPMTGRALAAAVASGNADYKLKLNLPIDALEKSTVQGSVTLASNDLQISPSTPRLGRSRGVVNFTENGFTLANTQANIFGGEARLEGGLVLGTSTVAASRTPAPTMLRATGTVTADGLRQAKELGFLARLALKASGSTAYSAVLGFRQGEPELTVTSNLQGLALSLPAPFTKSAETPLPLRLDTALLRSSLLPGPGGVIRLRDQFSLDLGRLASFAFVRDLSGPEPRVLRGSMAVGLSPQESAPLPDAGVVANINLNTLDLDAWSAVLSQAAGTSLTSAALSTPRNASPGAAAAVSSYLPTSLAVRARDLTVGGRQLHQVLVGGSREGLLWRANLDATELNGYLEYRQPSGPGEGRVFARLARLSIAPEAASEVEALLSEPPQSIPALDIVVEDFELRGKRLGRLEVEAINRGGGGGTGRDNASASEWRLNKLNVIMPEASFTATGNWARVNATSGAAALAPARRRTVMNFKLDIADGGELLSRLGMKGVVQKGRGKMEGQVAWVGSPLSLDYRSMGGAFNVNVESGQFLKADPGLAKLLGVLSLQALPRRLTLDFRDVFSDGFAFDFLRGDINIEQGIARTNNLQMKGINAAVLMEGRADIAKETQDIKVVVVPEINAGTASLIASVINPALGLGSFLAQLFLRRPLIEANTQEFHIDGPWVDPRITKVAH